MHVAKGALAAIAVILLFICLILAAFVCARAWQREIIGGAPVRRGSPAAPHIVVDTLNLTHHLITRGTIAGPLSIDSIIAAIDATAPALRKKYAGHVMYVVKDRESVFNSEAAHDAYQAAAVRNSIYIYVVERYRDPPTAEKGTTGHSARGRDDFFMALLAHRWRCPVLSGDKLRDFDEFRGSVPPFHVYEFAFWRDLPQRDYIRPTSTAYSRLRKPRILPFGI